MRSLKIHSNRYEPPKKQSFEPEATYQQFLKIKPNAPLSYKMAKIFAEICSLIEQKTSLKLDLSNCIRKWVQKNDDRQDQVLEQFRQLLVQTIENLVHNYDSSQNNHSHHHVKIMRIKSDERIKLRLLKPNQRSANEYWENQEFKDLQKKQQQIYELQKNNKNLEKKILLLSVQFKKIKKNYEMKIEKYKRLLNTSLVHLQKQLNQEQFESHPELQNLNWAAERDFSYKKTNIDELNYEDGLRSARSQQLKKFGSTFNNENLKTQPSYRIATTPTISPTAMQYGRRFSSKNHGSK